MPPARSRTGSCRICGDRGAGAHYGVVTCIACKSFFKRTVQLCLTYKCEQSGSCRIGQATRRLCQACRFQCCLRAGMRTDLVRSLAGDAPEVQTTSKSAGSEASVATSPPESSASTTASTSMMTASSIDSGELGVEAEQLLQRLADIEPAEFSIDVSFSAERWLPDSVRNVARLLTAADSHAAAAARWVSRLPGLDSLTPAERERLFEENWPAPVVASVAWGSRSEPAGSLRICANLQLTNAPESAPRALQMALTEAGKLADRLRYQQLNRSEYLALKPLLFLCSQDAELRDRAEPLMDPYLRLLGRVCPNRDRRASLLLLLSGSVGRVRVRASSFWRRAAAREGHALPPLLGAALRGLVRLRYYWP